MVVINRNKAIAHQTNQPQLALTHCQAAISQELGIPLVKDYEELLAKIQEDLDPPQSPL